MPCTSAAQVLRVGSSVALETVCQIYICVYISLHACTLCFFFPDPKALEMLFSLERFSLQVTGLFRGLSLLVPSTDLWDSLPGQWPRHCSPLVSLLFLLISLPLLPPSITALEDRTHFTLIWQRSLCWTVGDALVDARMNCLCCDGLSLSIPLPLLVCSRFPSPELSLGKCSSLEPRQASHACSGVPGGPSSPSSPASECLNMGGVVSGTQVWISLLYNLSHKLSNAFYHTEGCCLCGGWARGL